MALVLFAVAVLMFSMSRVRGDPRTVWLSPYTRQDTWDAWGRRMGLDKPIVVQFFIWMGKALKGDLGDSLRDGRPVTKMMMERLPAALQLGLAGWIAAVLLGWPLGVLSAVKRATIWDYAARTFAVLGQAMPPFWVGIMLILIFAVQLEWLPVARRGGPSHYVLPVITLAWWLAAGQLRLVRSAMLEVLDSEYVKLARAKGVKNRAVIWRHALKNAAIPPLTFAGIALVGYVTSAVLVEQVFAWPGLGTLAVDAVIGNDFPVISGTVLLVTLLFVVVSFLLDIVYVYIDPRIRIT